MTEDDARLDELAGAIVNGAPVDWRSAESSASNESIRRVVRELEVIAGIARVHETELPSSEDERTASGDETDSDESVRSWGPLRLLEKIGEGGYGEVFRAWDTRLDREVALKLLPAISAPDSHVRGSVIREGRLLAKVRHPNVVTIHGAEQIGDRIGLWMELVRGETLEQLLQANAVFSEADVVAIGIELCQAVSAVHAAGLLHRDIKAQNVILARDRRVVLMDFGTGKELDDGSSSDLTGTPLYLAPEVLDGGSATARSDIYSLGVLLFHLVTGSYPVRGRTIRDLRRAHERHERIPLRTARPEVRPALARVVERACDPQAERRYPTVDALARDLGALQPTRWIVRLSYGFAALVAALLALSFVTRAPAHSRAPVIAVLPFTDLSPAPGSGRLVDSLTAGLIQQLGIIDGLKVTGQRSSFMVRNKSRDLTGVGKQLGANLMVVGDARFSAGTLVIHAALRPSDGGESLWTDTLTREITSAGDLTDVLTEITRTIVNKLRLTLGPTQRRYTTDLATYEQYLRARELRDEGISKAREAIPLFEDVIRRDASYAPALAALAATYGSLALWHPVATGFAISPNEAAALMGPLTEKALEIDPLLAEAHVSMAYLRTFARRWADAEASFRHAIALDPTITAVYGDFVLSTLEPWGRLEEALQTVDSALDADPLSLDLRRLLSRLQLNVGKFDEALANCQRVLEVNPEFLYAEELCARALVGKGRTTEALEILRKRPILNEGWIGYVYAVTGRRDEAHALAARNGELPNRQAVIYAALGDKGRAFEALERLAVRNPARAGSHLEYPELATLRGDPRVDALRRKMGFPLP